MLKLCGVHLSNYHNKVRIALLEKGVPFEEDANCAPSQKEDTLARSPHGKVPWIELGDGRRLSESQVICDYLEDAYPQKPLYPKDAFERAKVRELITFIEWYGEMVARRLYGQAFFGKGPVSDGARRSVDEELTKGIRALKGMTSFSPYIAGDALTFADCSAFVHLPLISLATKMVYGRDFLDEMPQVKPYIKMLAGRPAFAKVNDDRKSAQAALAARAKEKAGAS